MDREVVPVGEPEQPDEVDGIALEGRLVAGRDAAVVGALEIRKDVQAATGEEAFTGDVYIDDVSW